MQRRRHPLVKAASIALLTLAVCGSTLAVPFAATAGEHHYYPGTETKNDPVYPGFGNGGYDVIHYAITIGYTPATTSSPRRPHRTCPGSASTSGA